MERRVQGRYFNKVFREGLSEEVILKLKEEMKPTTRRTGNHVQDRGQPVQRCWGREQLGRLQELVAEAQ